MTPLQTYNEYAAAKTVAKRLELKYELVGLSEKDESEMLELLKRIERYEDSGAKIQFGLEAQGHIPYIERTLAEKGFTYHTWQEIAKHIGWDVLTAVCYYQDYKDKPHTTDQSEPVKGEKTALMMAIETISSKMYTPTTHFGKGVNEALSQAISELESLLPVEKQQIIDAYDEGKSDEIGGRYTKIGNDYFNYNYEKP